MFTYFNNKSVRNLVVAFGSLFNNLHIRRFNADGSTKENIRIPLAYGSREKFLARLEQGGSITNEDGEFICNILDTKNNSILNELYISSTPSFLET